MNTPLPINKIKRQLSFVLLVLFFLAPLGNTLYAQNNDVWTERWISCSKTASPNPAHAGSYHWINYEFDQPQAIATSHFWNANFSGESDMGVQEVFIDFSIDGLTWESLGTYTFPKANESDNYAGFAGPDFGGASIKKILITINSTYGNASCASLAEVRFDIDPNACAGIIDECGICDGPGALTWFQDQDGDGLGNAGISLESCDQPTGYVDNNNDPCDNGLIGWETIGPLFADNGCNGCHGSGAAGGLNLLSYDGIRNGGNYCGSDLLTGTTLVNIISIDNYTACGNTISFPSMNQRTGGAFDASELALIQDWIDGGALEDCANPNPCANQGGDTDGDGVCDETDNCVNVSNPNQTDSDGNGIGDACDSADPCASVSITCANNIIRVSGLSVPVAQLIVFDSNWATVFSCSGDCNETETIAVNSGSHYVTAKLYTPSWEPICQVSKSLDCDGTDPCAGLGGDSDGDGICDDNDQCPDLDNALLGQSCDDGDPNTENDIYSTASCACEGTLIVGPCVGLGGDSDGDGICDDNDQCPDLDNALLGQSCDDGDPNTENDIYSTASCACEGTLIVGPCVGLGGDSDGDGICDDNDQCPDLDNALFGQACDDGNPNTMDDIYEASSCSCEGTPIIIGTCAVTPIDCGFTLTGLSAADDTKIFDANWTIVWRCDPWINGACDATETISNLDNGIYHVQACGAINTYTVSCGGGGLCATQGGDTDNDGICNDNDNCIDVANPDQLDSDGNGIGDACESSDPCAAIDISCSNNIVSVSGLAGAPVTHLQVFDTNWQTLYDCAGDCNDLETVVIGSGEHHVIVTYYTANWQLICKVQEDFNCNDINPILFSDLEHLFFQVEKDQGAAQLQWNINTDYKTAYFEIEHSTRENDFAWIGEEKSRGDAKAFNSYHFKDHSPKNGLNYYRIKQVFADGSFRYSEVQEVEFVGDLNRFFLYPNPADSEIFVHLKPFSGKAGTLYMHDVLGRVVYQEHFVAIPTRPCRIAIPASLGSGVYALSLKIDGQKLRTELVIIAKK